MRIDKNSCCINLTLGYCGDMTNAIETMVSEVKTAKATALYWHDVSAYGGERQALRALDCISRDEAIKMLSAVQSVSIFKRDGKLVVQ